VGDPAYPLSEALAYYINKDSEWLKATAVATPGLTANHELAQKEPDKYIAMGVTTTWEWSAREAKWDYYKQLRWMGLVMPYTYLWVTYDENVKTMQDFAGKRVNIKRKGASDTPSVEEILKRSGVYDDVATYEYAGFGGNRNNLKDGLVDVAMTIPTHVLPAAFSKGSFIEELETKGPLYYISMPKDILTEMAALPFEEQFGFQVINIYPGALGGTQSEVITGALELVFFAADERMPEDVVKEVSRVIWERAGQFGTWHPMGQNITKEWLTAYMYSPDLMHPATVKFYEEEGVEINDIKDLLP
jgi:TRAP transporter TAXI family solute receptor